MGLPFLCLCEEGFCLPKQSLHLKIEIASAKKRHLYPGGVRKDIYKK
jgi:hypothetical protein